MSAQQPNPYAPPTATVADAADASGELEIAGRGTRLGAYLLDALISILFALPALIVGGGALFASISSGASAETLVMEMFTGMFGVLLLLGMIAWGVITAVLVHRYGQTIGKRLVGIKVVRKDGSRASLGRIFWLRNVVNALPSAIPIVGNFYFFIDSLFIFTESNQCVHDKIADTIVVRA
jgi:uncharacterized RDD family membrane protein YckC